MVEDQTNEANGRGRRCNQNCRFQGTNLNRYKNANAGSTAKNNMPILKYGPNNNFVKFKDKLKKACMEKYGNGKND